MRGARFGGAVRGGWFVVTALAFCFVAATQVDAAGVHPPNLVADFTGTYQQDGGGSASSMELRIESQHKRSIRKARIFATNLSEYIGKGRIAKDATTAKFALRTSGGGRYVSYMKLAAQIVDGGSILSGTYEIKQRGIATRTGTFDVAR
jgi:hypothetical protein